MKLDKSFVMSMTVEKGDAAIVRSTIGLAHDLGLTVVAEGVENEATKKLLATYGCDLGQGFYLGRPARPGSVLARLRSASERERSLPSRVAEEARPKTRMRSAHGGADSLRSA